MHANEHFCIVSYLPSSRRGIAVAPLKPDHMIGIAVEVFRILVAAVHYDVDHQYGF